MTFPLHTDTEGKRCTDLDVLYGARYRLTWEADGATRSQWPRGDWPWLRRVPCRYGYLYVVGGEMLGAVAVGHPAIGRRLRRLPGVTRAFGAADETVAHFPVAVAEAVLALLRPYRRRTVSAAERDRLRRVGAAHRFGADHGTESESTAVGSTISRQDDLTPVPTGTARSEGQFGGGAQ